MNIKTVVITDYRGPKVVEVTAGLPGPRGVAGTPYVPTRITTPGNYSVTANDQSLSMENNASAVTDVYLLPTSNVYVKPIKVKDTFRHAGTYRIRIWPDEADEFGIDGQPYYDIDIDGGAITLEPIGGNGDATKNGWNITA